MCGRYALTTPETVLAALRFLRHVRFDLVPRFNIAPTQTIPIVRAAQDGPELVGVRWGLIPHWSKEGPAGPPLINARSETADEKPAFRDAFVERRCLVPASGFYEWRKLSAGKKQPYYIHRNDDDLMVFAGLWESWLNAATGELIESCAILTTDANALLSPLHDRMPVILDSSDCERWLDSDGHDTEAVRPLLRPLPEDALVAHPVTRRVNSYKDDDPGLIEPTEEGEMSDPAEQPGLFD